MGIVDWILSLPEAFGFKSKKNVVEDSDQDAFEIENKWHENTKNELERLSGEYSDEPYYEWKSRYPDIFDSAETLRIEGKTPKDASLALMREAVKHGYIPAGSDLDDAITEDEKIATRQNIEKFEAFKKKYNI